MSFPNPSINAEITRSALVENDGSAARQNDADSSRASLDAEELRDLERALYYGATSSEAGNGQLRGRCGIATWVRLARLARLRC
jgi:hypothetical protein